jgi:hypothetical protein
MKLGRRVRRNRRGGFDLKISGEEAVWLSSLLDQFLELIDDDDLKTGAEPIEPGLARLFPAVIRDDSEASADCRQMLQPDLIDSLRSGARETQNALAQRSCDEAQLASVARALNGLRLVLGTRLGVTEDSTDWDSADPALAPFVALYHYLSHLQQEVIEELLSGLDRSAAV